MKRAKKKERVEDHLLPNKFLSGDIPNNRVVMTERVECSQCGKTFGSEDSLRSHERTKRHNVLFPNAKKSVYGGSLLSLEM